MQQAASNALGLSPAATMSVAQKLYEGVKTPWGVSGVITYMRTDSLNVSKDAMDAARELISSNFGDKYMPAKPRVFKKKAKNAQEAHEAIRPTNLEFTPAMAREFLVDRELKVYTLIYNRFLASCMSDATFLSQNIFISSPRFTFKAHGSKLTFDGFYKVLGTEGKDKFINNIELNEAMPLVQCELNEQATTPPPRFSEASLIKKLEDLGIGRPSTYAPTLSTLKLRKYIEVDKKQIKATDISFKVIEMLEQSFLELVDSNFTAKLEDSLDEIASAKVEWQKLLWDFYEPFSVKLKEQMQSVESLKKTIPTGEECPECGKPLVIRMGRYGEFTGCSDYPKCKYIKKLPKAPPVLLSQQCELCGKPLVERKGRFGTFLGCSGYPTCRFIYKEKKEKKKKEGDEGNDKLTAKKTTKSPPKSIKITTNKKIKK